LEPFLIAMRTPSPHAISVYEYLRVFNLF
jgi:hypothetical protein